MAISVEAILADARRLVVRLKEHDSSADCLIARTQSLQKQLDAMKQFQDCLNELNETARHRPRLGLIITLAQENRKIRELQSENLELRQLLSDHQSALEVIMTKYREQLGNLARANQVELSLLQRSTSQQEDIQTKSDKISEMSAVMWQAANMEDRTDSAHDVIARLQRENHVMRELLQLELLHSADEQSAAEADKPPSADRAIQTQSDLDESPFCTGDFATIRPRLSTSRTPPSIESCTTDAVTGHSAYEQNANSKSPRLESPPSATSPENCADTSSDRVEASGDVCLPLTVSDVDSVRDTDEVRNVSASESVETLVDPDELSTNDEHL